LLLADEPTGNLDSATGNGILEVFEQLNKAGQTIVMVTHDARVAHKAGRVITLTDGRVER
jgi:putative ABC transport system ATP-binding protein